MVAIVLVLMAISGLLILSFGSDTRTKVASSEARGRLTRALNSAEREALAHLALVSPGNSAPERGTPWAKVLGAASSRAEALGTIDVAVSREVFAREGVELAPVELTCLHRGSKNGWWQGLIEMELEATQQPRPGKRPITRHRRVWRRFSVLADATGGQGRMVVHDTPLACGEEER
jgi:hypothetical protein